jgi:ubiquitin C-terminal hydrolase
MGISGVVLTMGKSRVSKTRTERRSRKNFRKNRKNRSKTRNLSRSRANRKKSRTNRKKNRNRQGKRGRHRHIKISANRRFKSNNTTAVASRPLFNGAARPVNATSSFPNQYVSGSADGIQNEGGTCYLNSALQQLYNCVEFRNIVLAYDSSSIQDQEIREMFKLFQQVFVDLGTAKSAINIRNFLVKLNQLEIMKIGSHGQRQKAKAISFNIFEQQDASEFLTLFLDLLGEIDKKLLAPVQCTILTELKSIDPGLFESTSANTYQIMLLYLPSKSLIESLNNLYEKESEKEPEKYNIVQEVYIDITREEKIQSLPQMLIFTINRFSNNSIKINTAYTVPDEINMYPYLSEKVKIYYPNQKADYELIGTIIHSGTHSKGHYISWVKDYTTNRWKQYNDSQVSDIDSQYTIDKALRPTQDFQKGSATPYVLFYRKKN